MWLRNTWVPSSPPKQFDSFIFEYDYLTITLLHFNIDETGYFFSNTDFHFS